MFESFEVIRNAPMRDYTTLRLGGPADYLASPRSTEEISALFEEAGRNGLPLLYAKTDIQKDDWVTITL